LHGEDHQGDNDGRYPAFRGDRYCSEGLERVSIRKACQSVAQARYGQEDQ
jgi:hypothetical protein